MTKSWMCTAASLIVAVVSIFATVAAFAQTPAAPTEVTLALSSNAFPYGGLYIAQKTGLFEKRGLKPRIIVMDSGNAAMAALISGSAQFSGSGPGEVLAARARKQPVVIVGNFYRGLSASIILAKSAAAKTSVKPDSPIADRIKALDGLTVAVPSATSAYFHPVRSAADKVGAKIKFVYMAQPAMVAALESGAIHALVAASPYSIMAVSKGTGIFWVNGPKGEFPTEFQPTSSACLQSSESYIASHPEVVASMRAVLDDIAALIKNSPDQARKALAEAYTQVSPPDLEQTFALDSPNWAQPAFSEADMVQEIKILQSSGLVTGVGDVPPASALWKRP